MDYLLLVSFIYILLIILFISDDENVEPKLTDQKRVLTIAHRGASGYAPENTIAAFDKALEMKADYIELDIQMSKDGELIVIHDTTVDRTTDGHGELKNMDLASLKKLDAGNWFDHKFAGERIPTLNEILDRYSGKIALLIELKDPSLYPGIEKKLAAELKKRRLHRNKDDSIIIQSFDHTSIKRIKSMLKSVSTSILINFHMPEISTEKLKQLSTFAKYVSHPPIGIDHSLVKRIHSSGMYIFTWTVNDIKTFHYLKSINVDGIITDFPDIQNKFKRIGNSFNEKNIFKESENNSLTYKEKLSGIELFTLLLYFAKSFYHELTK